MKIGKFIGMMERKMFKPKLVEHVPGQKRVYQNIWGKTIFQLEEETKSAGDILAYLDKAQVTQTPVPRYWKRVAEVFPLHKLPKDTPITQERFWGQRDRSLIDKIKCFLNDDRTSSDHLSRSPIHCVTKIRGKEKIHSSREYATECLKT